MPSFPIIIYSPNSDKSTQPKNVTTLHASGSGYTGIDPSIREFVNLEVLWLDNNQLNHTAIEELVISNKITPNGLGTTQFGSTEQKLSGLMGSTMDSKMGSTMGKTVKKHAPLDDQNHAKGTIRLRELYLQYNRLEKFPESLIQMKFMKILLLHNNRLRDLDSVLNVLKRFLFLEHLDLFGNPLSEEQYYQERVLTQMSSKLRIFDRHAITELERDAAKKIVQKMKKLTNSKENTQDRSNSQKSSARITDSNKQTQTKSNVNKTSRIKEETKIVFGKTVHLSDLPVPVPMQETTPTLQLLNKECKRIKKLSKQDDPYNLKKIEKIPNEEILKSTLRFGLGTSHIAQQNQISTHDLLDFLNDSIPFGLITNDQKEALLHFDNLPIHELKSHFPQVDNFVSFENFFVSLCEIESSRCFNEVNQLRKENPIQPSKKEVTPDPKATKKGGKEPPKKEPLKKEPSKAQTTKAKSSNESTLPPAEEDVQSKIIKLRSTGTSWESLKLDFLEYLKNKKAIIESTINKSNVRSDSFKNIQF